MIDVTLQVAWYGMMNGFGVAAAASEPVFRDLWARYSEPHHHYHNLHHLAETLDTAAQIAASDTASDTVALASTHGCG